MLWNINVFYCKTTTLLFLYVFFYLFHQTQIIPAKLNLTIIQYNQEKENSAPTAVYDTQQ